MTTQLLRGVGTDRDRRTSAWALAAIVAGLAGCGALQPWTPPTLRPPAIEVSASHQPGSSLTGPLSESAPHAAGDEPLWMRCQALWVERDPALGDALDQHARLVVAPGRADLLQPLARRTSGLTAAVGEAALALRASIDAGAQGRTAIAWDQSDPLGPGVTYRVGAHAAGSGLAVEDLVVEAEHAVAEPIAGLALALGAAGEVARELVLLREPLLRGAGPFALVLPRRPQGEHEPAALVIFVEAERPPADRVDGDRAAAAADARAESAARAAHERRRDIAPAESERRELAAAARAALAPLVETMRADSDLVVQVQHRFGRADVERAELLANPRLQDAEELSRGLRWRRAEIGRARGELAAEVRASWGVGDRAAAEAATVRLRALDAESGTVEDALDRALELLKPGAERYREKRTRAAALAIARERIAALRAWFAQQGLDDLDARFQSRTPVFEAGPGVQAGTLLAVLRERQG